MEEMTVEELKINIIDTYVNLMRIKACETGENKELEYQIRIAKVKLQDLGVDISKLGY